MQEKNKPIRRIDRDSSEKWKESCQNYSLGFFCEPPIISLFVRSNMLTPMIMMEVVRPGYYEHCSHSPTSSAKIAADDTENAFCHPTYGGQHLSRLRRHFSQSPLFRVYRCRRLGPSLYFAARCVCV